MPVTTCTELTAMWARDGGFRECVGCHELKSVGIEEDGAWICEDCDGPECGCCEEKLLNQGCGDIVNRGCCSDGRCAHEPPIEALCGSCGTWDEEDEVWRCPDCQEKHEEDEEEGCGCGVCSRCVADDTCAAQCGDKGTITVVGKDGTSSLVCKDCCAWFKTQNK